MDLVDFDRGVFDNIVDDFEEMLRGATLHPIPLSALHGDNVITAAIARRGSTGRACSSILETVEVERNDDRDKPFRLPVQLVARPDQEFRGYAGQIVSGIDPRGRHGHASGRRAAPARVKRIVDVGRRPRRWRSRRCR